MPRFEGPAGARAGVALVAVTLRRFLVPGKGRGDIAGVRSRPCGRDDAARDPSDFRASLAAERNLDLPGCGRARPAERGVK